MRAVTLRSHGGPEVLTLEELPSPTAGPGQVRVRVAAVAMNHLDVWVRKGLPHLKLEYPFLLGADVAGTVDQVGAGVVGVDEGDEIVVNPGHSCGRCRECLSGRDNLCRHYRLMGEDISGGYAEQIVVPAQNVVPRPKSVTVEQAAAVPVTFLTAWQMLTRKAPVKPGDDVLVIAAGSGVGVAAVQIAKLHGARVIATASSDEKLERARALGADEVINHKSQDLVAEVKRLTGKRGVDIIFEHVGAEVWPKLILAAARGGRIVTCGATSGFDARTDLRHVFFRQLEILGSTMGSKGDLYPILEHVGAGRLKPVVDKIMPLTRAEAAHRLLEGRGIFGKIVLTP
ncbi:MAG: Alcohol dehydrogenase zinc-binding domain protein [Myxococcales bacterium]|nr:Alcohol dehydrogenase zinc-binding domain protein [Myxococcales bacterium]